MPRPKRSDKKATNFMANDVKVDVGDEDVYGAVGTSDLNAQSVEVNEFSGISSKSDMLAAMESGSDDNLASHWLAVSIASHIDASRVVVDTVSLQMPDDLHEGTVQLIGHELSKKNSGMQFLIGDFALWHIRKYVPDGLSGSEKNKAINAIHHNLSEQYGFSPKTIKNNASVCNKISPSLRRDDGNFSIHKAIANMKNASDEVLANALREAINDNMTIAEVREEVAIWNQQWEEKPKTIVDPFEWDKRPKPGSKFRNALKLADQGDAKALDDVKAELDDWQDWIDSTKSQLGIE